MHPNHVHSHHVSPVPVIPTLILPRPRSQPHRRMHWTRHWTRRHVPLPPAPHPCLSNKPTHARAPPKAAPPHPTHVDQTKPTNQPTNEPRQHQRRVGDGSATSSPHPNASLSTHPWMDYLCAHKYRHSFRAGRIVWCIHIDRRAYRGHHQPSSM